jgi:hypothetical protein
MSPRPLLHKYKLTPLSAQPNSLCGRCHVS